MTENSRELPGELMRLQKYLAHRGVASRRQIEEWIVEGTVLVNGKKANLGEKVDPMKDHIIVAGKRIRPGGLLKQNITFAIYKPKNFLCSHKDPHHSQTVFELLPPLFRKEKFICAGRLDKDSEGLVILTTDGQLAQQVMHPSFNVVKRYDVTLETPFNPQHLQAIRAGVVDEGEQLTPLKVIPARPGPTRCFEVHLNEGKKREIRRLFKAFGHSVRKLKRFQIGRLAIKNLPVGSAYKLSDEEIARLLA